MTESYKPCNGTEGAEFVMRFCERCERDRAYREWVELGEVANQQPESCSIFCDALLFEISEPEYPREWIKDANGPRCTAFVAEVHEKRFEPDSATRCEKTKDMFDD